jgi:hypothetical protein
MNKFWMMGGAIIAVSVTAMVWSAGPVRSSENLLGKAQSEFAMKARDALIQRYMTQSSAASAVVASPKPETLLPYAVASLEPVAAPTIVSRDMRLEAPAPEPQAAAEPQPVTEAFPEAPIASQDSVLPPAPPTASVASAAGETQAKNLEIAALPEEPAVSVSPKSIPAGASELAKADTPVVTPTHVAPLRRFKAERQTRHEPHARQERKSNTFADRSEDSYRSERAAPRYLTPHDLNSLRARSPELAAAIARYL